MSRYSQTWGGQSCPLALIDGAEGLAHDLKEGKAVDWWMIPEFAEGGYLVDFDSRTILIYSWDEELLDGAIGQIMAAWPTWSVSPVADGVLDFERHVAERGLHV